MDISDKEATYEAVNVFLGGFGPLTDQKKIVLDYIFELFYDSDKMLQILKEGTNEENLHLLSGKKQEGAESFDNSTG